MVLPAFNSKRDLTATSEVQASLARSPIKFCNHNKSTVNPSDAYRDTHRSFKRSNEAYTTSRRTKGSDSTGVDQRKDLLYHALVAELVKKLHGTTERVHNAY
jgi:hypothetical protein